MASTPVRRSDERLRRQVLLSLRPRFAQALLDESKLVELRRGSCRIPAESTCLVYASSPVQAVLGIIVVTKTLAGAPLDIWSQHGPETGLARREFDEYASGCRTLTALVIASPRRFEKPIPLDELRELQPGFVVPQSYRYMDDRETSALLGYTAHGDQPADVQHTSLQI